MNISLEGVGAIVTGASSGIGRAITAAFAASGAQVLGVGRDKTKLDAVASENRRAGTVFCCAADVTSTADRERVVSEALARMGAITTLVHCAGVFELGPFEESLERLDRHWETNVRATFALTQLALPHLRPNGSILMMSSIAGSIGFATGTAYCASKGAIEQLARSLALEEAANGVRVNTLAPGNVRTPMNAHLFQNPAYEQMMLNMTPLGRIAEVDDVTPAAVFLSSPAAAYITGTRLVIDGGWMAQ